MHNFLEPKFQIPSKVDIFSIVFEL